MIGNLNKLDKSELAHECFQMFENDAGNAYRPSRCVRRAGSRIKPNSRANEVRAHARRPRCAPKSGPLGAAFVALKRVPSLSFVLRVVKVSRRQNDIAEEEPETGGMQAKWTVH